MSYLLEKEILELPYPETDSIWESGLGICLLTSIRPTLVQVDREHELESTGLGGREKIFWPWAKPRPLGAVILPKQGVVSAFLTVDRGDYN